MASNSDPFITKKEAFLSFVRPTVYGLTIPDTAWHEVVPVGTGSGEPEFENGWVNFSGGFASAAFMKDPTGTVWIKGFIKSGTLTTPAFTLPVGYRMTGGFLVFATYSNAVLGYLRITDAGAVTPFTGSNVSFSIQCSFKAI